MPEASQNPTTQQLLHRGTVIPACPLALTAARKFDERHQRALIRYYRSAGAGGIAVGVHTTQFAIRDHGLYQPVLELVATELRASDTPFIKIAGACGPTKQAASEASIARSLGYDAVLLSLGAMRNASDAELIAHCRAISEILPLVGFYLQPAAGGRLLPYTFWRRFAEIENIVAIKIAPFNRYQTIDVIRAIAESGRNDIALYTGNDDNILLDLLTPYRFIVNGTPVERRIVGGLLGHWAVWTKPAVDLLAQCHHLVREKQPSDSSKPPTPIVGDDVRSPTIARPDGTNTDALRRLPRNADFQSAVSPICNRHASITPVAPTLEPPSHGSPLPAALLSTAIAITDCNAAFFDAANNYAGCIPGLHEVLRRQGLLAGTWCLDPNETLSPNQLAEIDRVYSAYPDLNDDTFIATHRDAWLR
jgi:hypothetical protein